MRDEQGALLERIIADAHAGQYVSVTWSELQMCFAGAGIKEKWRRMKAWAEKNNLAFTAPDITLIQHGELEATIVFWSAHPSGVGRQ